jgi:hypothetical protein
MFYTLPVELNVGKRKPPQKAGYHRPGGETRKDMANQTLFAAFRCGEKTFPLWEHFGSVKNCQCSDTVKNAP